jgi:predicted Zn finger-like uncharacterized protein
MALATTCPQCKTSFKVVPDQLKLRRGLVRCGVCQHVFSGIDFISQMLPVKPASIETEQPNSSDHRSPDENASNNVPDVAANEDHLNTAFFIPDTVLAPTTKMMMAAFEERLNSDPGSNTLQSSSKPPQSISLREDEKVLHKASPKSSLFDQSERAEPEAISFFSTDEKKFRFKGFSSRSSVMLALVCIGLLVVLSLQLLLGARHSLAANYPNFAPTLEAMADVVGLKVEPPRTLDSLTIESFELQAAASPNIFSVSAILRNSSAHVVRWPAIELTLTDSAGTLLLKKVLLPAEYLPPAQAEKLGFKPQGELPIKLALEVKDINPSGFSAALFYP